MGKTGILAGLLLAAALTGCAPLAAGLQDGSRGAESGAAQGKNSWKDRLEDYQVRLPEEYFITYEIYDEEEGTIESISKAVDKEGNIYYKGKEEYLFIKEDNGFLLYQPEQEEFIRREDTKYASSYIEELTKDFNDCTEEGIGSLVLSGNPSQTGECEVAGRICDTYTISVQVVNFIQKYQYAIDKETNACLEIRSEKDISGFKTETAEELICTRFDTEEIDLEEEFSVHL